MNILTQMSQHLQDSVIANLLSEHIQQLTSPLLSLPSLDNYTQLIERLGNALHQLALSSLKHTLEQMDLQFRLFLVVPIVTMSNRLVLVQSSPSMANSLTAVLNTSTAIPTNLSVMLAANMDALTAVFKP